MKKKSSTLSKLLYKVNKHLHSRTGVVLALGLLAERLTNEMSTDYDGNMKFIERLFSVNLRFTNIFTWIAICMLFAIIILRRLIPRIIKKHEYDLFFAMETNKRKHSVIADYAGIGWGAELSLLTCPELSRGWPIKEISIRGSSKKFEIPAMYKKQYDDYFKENYEKKRFHSDNVKYMLVQNPTSFSDDKKLILNTVETKYSEVQFYRDNVAVNDSELTQHIYGATNDMEISFPHSLCMHAIVITSDEKILFTKSSKKKSYFPLTWSCGVEEQLSDKDFMGVDETELAYRWSQRLLIEELGLDHSYYIHDNIRVLSAFLESDCLNISVCVHINVNITANKLDAILNGLPRSDYEFTEWDFKDYKDIMSELFFPTIFYHPSSQYRMLLALIFHYGEPNFAEKFYEMSN